MCTSVVADRSRRRCCHRRHTEPQPDASTSPTQSMFAISRSSRIGKLLSLKCYVGREAAARERRLQASPIHVPASKVMYMLGGGRVEGGFRGVAIRQR